MKMKVFQLRGDTWYEIVENGTSYWNQTPLTLKQFLEQDGVSITVKETIPQRYSVIIITYEDNKKELIEL